MQQQQQQKSEEKYVLAEVGILVLSLTERHKKCNSKEPKDLRSC